MKKLPPLQRLEKLTLATHDACLKILEDEFLSRRFDKNLAGACAVASYSLWEKLLFLKYDVSLVVGKFEVCGDKLNHCWLQADQLIIDPTYSQFGFQKKILISDDVKITHRFIKKHVNRKAVNDLKKWCMDENPNFYSRIWRGTKLILKPHEELYD